MPAHDRYPVKKGHLAVMPFRHAADYFSLTVEEKHALLALVDECKEVIEENFKPAGYTIGFNAGTAAGQTVMHCHCHVILRYVGDVRGSYAHRGFAPRRVG